MSRDAYKDELAALRSRKEALEEELHEREAELEAKEHELETKETELDGLRHALSEAKHPQTAELSAPRKRMAVERPDLGAHLRMTFAFLIGLGGLGGGIVQIREGHMAMGIFLMLAGAFLAMLILQVNRSD